MKIVTEICTTECNKWIIRFDSLHGHKWLIVCPNAWRLRILKYILRFLNNTYITPNPSDDSILHLLFPSLFLSHIHTATFINFWMYQCIFHVSRQKLTFVRPPGSREHHSYSIRTSKIFNEKEVLKFPQHSQMLFVDATLAAYEYVRLTHTYI